MKGCRGATGGEVWEAKVLSIVRLFAPRTALLRYCAFLSLARKLLHSLRPPLSTLEHPFPPPPPVSRRAAELEASSPGGPPDPIVGRALLSASFLAQSLNWVLLTAPELDAIRLMLKRGDVSSIDCYKILRTLI